MLIFFFLGDIFLVAFACVIRLLAFLPNDLSLYSNMFVLTKQ